MNIGEQSAGSWGSRGPKPQCAPLALTARGSSRPSASISLESAVKTSNHNLKSATAGVFTPQKGSHTTDQAFLQTATVKQRLSLSSGHQKPGGCDYSRSHCSQSETCRIWFPGLNVEKGGPREAIENQRPAPQQIPVPAMIMLSPDNAGVNCRECVLPALSCHQAGSVTFAYKCSLQNMPPGP